jgi:hypothetical protein
MKHIKNNILNISASLTVLLTSVRHNQVEVEMFMCKPLIAHTPEDCTWLKKVLVGSNVFIFAQMVHDQWLGKCTVLLHMLKPLHQNALVVTVPFIELLL